MYHRCFATNTIRKKKWVIFHKSLVITIICYLCYHRNTCVEHICANWKEVMYSFVYFMNKLFNGSGILDVDTQIEIVITHNQFIEIDHGSIQAIQLGHVVPCHIQTFECFELCRHQDNTSSCDPCSFSLVSLVSVHGVSIRSRSLERRYYRKYGNKMNWLSATTETCCNCVHSSNIHRFRFIAISDCVEKGLWTSLQSSVWSAALQSL